MISTNLNNSNIISQMKIDNGDSFKTIILINKISIIINFK